MLPPDDELPEVLLDLAVPHEDINTLVAVRPVVTEEPGFRWLLERSVANLVRDMGVVRKGSDMPPVADGLLPEEGRLAAAGRCLPVYVFLAALPYVRAHHRERGIPETVSRRTLADLGRHLAVHRRRTGRTGLLHPWWPTLHFRGELYQLGRLQFQRARLDERTGAAVAAAGLPLGSGGRPLGPGGPALNVHIPDFSGPMTPGACDASVDRARVFFPRHFPEEPYTVAMCNSWLLDRQLREYLPESSNIVRFQDRFHDAPPLPDAPAEPDDTEPVAFVFGDPALDIAGLPRRTAVERAVTDHLRAGGHWYGGYGWFTL
ncbi:acyltransferase domain-containing protein [Streptomyces sp. NPDC048845]|uniref:acyltransferase domain-containing protein n=1 Tax=Streptomyces sp. NPDC048845 TaxID=3155390 RepID=UPI0034137184